MATLREQIAKLSSTLPEFKDPEDYFEDETTARLTEKDEEDISDLPSQKSKLRQRAAPLLTETDTKYAGKRTSRKKLEEVEQLASSLPDDYENDEHDNEDEDDKDEDDYDDDDDEDDKDEDDYDDDEDKDNDVGEDSLEEGDNSNTKVEMDYENERSEEDENLAEFQSNFKTVTLNDSKPEFSFEDDGDFKKYADDEDFNDEDDDDVSDDEGDVSSDNEEENQDEEIDEEEMKSFSKTSTREEVQKGEAARQQLGLWDSFLEGRIKLQKVAGIINKIPQPNVWKEFEKNGREEFRQSATDTQKMLKKLLDKLVQLQTLLLLQNTETRSIVTGRKGGREEKKQNEDDEEIPSDTDEEEKPEQKQIPVIGVKRKIRMEYYPEFLAKRHKEFQTFRNNTIQKWYDKTRLSGGKLKSKSFANFDQSTLHQIEQILGDKERLIKRTQLKRSVYTILGKPDEEMNTDQQSEHTETGIGGDSLKNYDAEIFDDSDFYHQQLREFIERKTADIDDPVAISRQWLEIQKLRNKVKKKIDTKASKGRKTRYNTHSKLVNFMAGVDNCSWTDESKDDLYKSLFGKRLNGAETVLNDSGVKLLQMSDES